MIQSRWFFRIKKLCINVWYKKEANLALDVIRIGVGALMFITYALSSKDLLVLYSDLGYLPKEAITEYINNPLIHSLLFYFNDTWQYILFYVIFLIACAAFTMGCFTKWVKWLVLIGHISLVHRNPLVYYGVDNVLSILLFVMCLAPVGKHFSWDRHRLATKHRVQSGEILPLFKSRWGFACTRLIQIQMATLFFYSGARKLMGNVWWSGDALWIAALNYETYFIPLGWMASHYWIANLLCYMTILMELAYPFLIWDLKTRPYILAGAVILHIGIAIVLGMYFFAFVMICGHLSFARPQWIIQWGNYLIKKSEA